METGRRTRKEEAWVSKVVGGVSPYVPRGFTWDDPGNFRGSRIVSDNDAGYVRLRSEHVVTVGEPYDVRGDKCCVSS